MAFCVWHIAHLTSGTGNRLAAAAEWRRRQLREEFNEVRGMNGFGCVAAARIELGMMSSARCGRILARWELFWAGMDLGGRDAGECYVNTIPASIGLGHL